MEKVKMFKVTRVAENNNFYVAHVVAQSKEAAIRESSLNGVVLSCDEIDVEINLKQLVVALYDNGFCDCQVGIITDLVCKSFSSINYN